MTTVIWDGDTRTLVADSMATRKAGNKPIFKTETATKIADLTELNITTRNGEKLLAIGVAGDANTIATLTQFIVKEAGNWANAAHDVKRRGASFCVENAGASAILITSRTAYVFFMGTGVQVTKYKLSTFLSIGSGQAVALTAKRVFGTDAFGSMLAAMAVDEGTGFLVMSVRVTNSAVRDHRMTYVDDFDTEIARLRKSVGKNAVVKLKKATTSLGKRFKVLEGFFNDRDLSATREREAQAASIEKKVKEGKTAIPVQKTTVVRKKKQK